MTASNGDSVTTNDNLYEVGENEYKALLDAVADCGDDLDLQQQCIRDIAAGMGGASLTRRLFGVFFPTLGSDAEVR